MRIIKILLVLLFAVVLTSCSQKEKAQKVSDTIQHDAKKVESELVRKGIIDVETIDHNHDGKVHECPMDWNVLSDKAGDCPVCGMKLKEYTLADTKANLIKYGYKIKE